MPARASSPSTRAAGSARWADAWLGIDVGTDVALSNTMAREILHAGLHNREFIERATTGFDEYAASVGRGREQASSRPASHEVIRDAPTRTRADRAIICWTLSIWSTATQSTTSSLISLALLTGHVGRYSRGEPAARLNNVRRRRHGRDLEQAPRLPDIERDMRPDQFEKAWGDDPPFNWHRADVQAVDEGELPRSTSSASPARRPTPSTRKLLGLDHLVVRRLLTWTPIADVVLPASAAGAGGGTVTNERRVSGCKGIDAGQAGTTSRSWRHRQPHGHDLGRPTQSVDKLRSLADARRHDLSAARGARRDQWPCWTNTRRLALRPPGEGRS
jgi:formate dehydrogenase major subunit